jgi:predicted DNA-binding transcriptional regulator YafY
VELLDKTFTRKRGFSLQAYAERSFGVFQEKPFDVVWRFSPKVAPDARQFLFHPTQKMTDDTDGSLTVSFCAGGALEMCWHLFTWDDQVKILRPTRLRRLFEQLKMPPRKQRS